MVVIAYDIVDEIRLNKIAKFLESNGIRAQKSVFELDMSIRKANKIFNELEEMIEDNDKCFMFVIKEKEDIQSDTSIDRIF